MDLSTGRELENVDLQIIFVEGYNMALEDHDIINSINSDILHGESPLTKDEATEVLKKYNEFKPLAEKALDQIFEDLKLDIL
jgi:hypothetical protein